MNADSPSDKLTRPSKRLLPKACLFLVSLALAVVGAELLLAQTLPQPTMSRLDTQSPRCFRPDPILPWRLQPGASTRLVSTEFDHAIHINGQGMRMDRDVEKETPAGRKRILVVGDSFVFGWGVEAHEAFPQLLEAALGERDQPTEVLNMGFTFGPAPPSYFVGLRQEDMFEADALVVSLYVGNDIVTPEYVHWAETDADGLPTRLECDLARIDDFHRMRSKEPLARYSIPGVRSSHLAMGLMQVWDYWMEADETPGKKGTQRVRARPNEDSGKVLNLNPPDLYKKRWSPWISEASAKVVKSLAALRDLCERRGQRFLVTIVPTKQQVYVSDVRPNERGRARLLRKPREPLTTLPMPQQRLVAKLDAVGIEAYDLLGPIVEAQQDQLYYRKDGHWTDRGHALVAKILAAEIERRGLLDD